MSVTQTLRLSYIEMLHIESILSIAIDGATNKDSKRLHYIMSSRKKIVDALEQAERDGLFDVEAAAKQLGLKL